LPRRARLQTDAMTESPGTTNNRSAAAVPPLVAEDHVCPDCGVAYLDVSIERAAEVIGGLPASFRAAMAAIPPDAYRRRPEAGTWSVVEYLCHVRDVYATYTIRLHRARTEPEPVLEPMLNDLRARRFDYLHRDVDAVLDELEANAAGFRAEIARTPSGSWDRRVSRLPGERRTARWLARQAVHEGVHHLRDIEQVSGQVSS
jgi:uncharacterized damage-inducible protein DinB